MSSILDPFFHDLFERLNQQGLSYRMVCQYLTTVDVKISAQALRSWHVRRSKKLMTRSLALPSTSRAFGTHAAAKPESALTDAGPDLAPETSVAVVQRTVKSQVLTAQRPLELEIAAAEKKLAALNHSPSTGFVVRCKALTPEHFPNAAGQQFQKGVS